MPWLYSCQQCDQKLTTQRDAQAHAKYRGHTIHLHHSSASNDRAQATALVSRARTSVNQARSFLDDACDHLGKVRGVITVQDVAADVSIRATRLLAELDKILDDENPQISI